MKKLGYVRTSWDQWGPIFFFSDWESAYHLRLAGNPILLLEAYYNKLWWENFMKIYKAVLNSEKDIDKNSLKLLSKAKLKAKEFFECILELQRMDKSLLVIYKE